MLFAYDALMLIVVFALCCFRCVCELMGLCWMRWLVCFGYVLFVLVVVVCFAWLFGLIGYFKFE